MTDGAVVYLSLFALAALPVTAAAGPAVARAARKPNGRAQRMESTPDWEGTGFREFLDYWRGLRKAGGVARWSDFDCTTIEPLLGHVNAIDVIDGGRDFRFRVYGTDFTICFDLELTGRCVSEIGDPARSAKSLKLYRAALASGQPQGTLYRVRHDDHPHAARDGEDAWMLRLAVPFTAGDGRVDRLLGYGDLVGARTCRAIFGNEVPEDGAVFPG